MRTWIRIQTFLLAVSLHAFAEDMEIMVVSPRERALQYIKEGNMASLQNILTNAEVDITDVRGQHPTMPLEYSYLHVAVEHERYDILLFILNTWQNIIDVNAAVTPELKTPLHLAAEIGYLMGAQALIDFGADVNAQTEIRESALHLSIRYEHHEFTRYMVKVPGVNLEITDYELDTPFLRAVLRGDESLVRFLRESGSRVKARNYMNISALHMALAREHNGIARLLLEWGAKTHKLDNAGQSPLKYAVRSCNYEGVALLAQYGANMNARNAVGENALYWAADLGNENMIELVLYLGVEPNVLNKYGQSALDYCSDRTGSRILILLLVTNGVPIPPKSAESILHSMIIVSFPGNQYLDNFETFVNAALQSYVSGSSKFGFLCSISVYAIYRGLRAYFPIYAEERGIFRPAMDILAYERNVATHLKMILDRLGLKTYMGTLPLDILEDIFEQHPYLFRKLQAAAYTVGLVEKLRPGQNPWDFITDRDFYEVLAFLDPLHVFEFRNYLSGVSNRRKRGG